ncbi:MAG: hypothetical protein FJ150_10630 [Euryarchaeota archaeon]|nr:hypothetical protein [Euryarchaeota archaeon]
MIKSHDMVANEAASKFNVTWSLTTPIAVSVLNYAYEGYMTLECNHCMGMDVFGAAENAKVLNFVILKKIKCLKMI